MVKSRQIWQKTIKIWIDIDKEVDVFYTKLRNFDWLTRDITSSLVWQLRDSKERK